MAVIDRIKYDGNNNGQPWMVSKYPGEHEDGQKERTEEYFYRDVTNFSSAAETEEQIVADKVSCTGKTSYVRKNITYDSMSVIVPGDKFSCAMTRNDYSEKAIQGMKAKLREKKNQR